VQIFQKAEVTSKILHPELVTREMQQKMSLNMNEMNNKRKNYHTKTRCQIIDQEKVHAAMDYTMHNLAHQNFSKKQISH
jgi:hypothetical protein